MDSNTPISEGTALTTLPDVTDTKTRKVKVMASKPTGSRPNARTEDDYVKLVIEAWQVAVVGILESGRWLSEARANMPHGQWRAMVDTKLRRLFKHETARRLIKIAQDERITNASIRSLLPPHWRVLWELHRLSDEDFEAARAAGIIHPDMKCKDVARFKKTRERERNVAKLHAAHAALGAGASTIVGNLHNQDCVRALDGPGNFADAATIDLSYAKVDLPFYDVAGRVLAHVMKDGASLLAWIGQVYYLDALNLLREHLNFQFPLVHVLLGNRRQQIISQKVSTNSKHVAWFVKGRYQGPLIRDTIIVPSSLCEPEKNYHDWQQHESDAHDWMSYFVHEGDCVFDLALGTGTFGVVAVKLGARIVGYEIEKATYDIAVARISLAHSGLGSRTSEGERRLLNFVAPRRPPLGSPPNRRSGNGVPLIRRPLTAFRPLPSQRSKPRDAWSRSRR